MSVFGIGIDIVELKRVDQIYSKYGDKFAKKILSNSELKNFQVSNDKISFLAKRFAAKEAVGKALGIGILNGILLKNIFITHDSLGKPLVKINNIKKLKLHLDKIIHISISDEKKYAVANAIILNK
tara:strand:+ start:3337 stop:3714 length:378 start_codon:yes stop_codon:yes gene_type:complete